MISVGITGGIGSGKSTVCRIFLTMGVPVYYSDNRAKELMRIDPRLVAQIQELLGKESYTDGELNKPYIASRIFSDTSLLSKMNSLVHPAVVEDFEQWKREQELMGAKYVVFESAILFESQLSNIVDKSITISTPQEQRIERVMMRNKVSRKEVEARMVHQMSDDEREALSNYTIYNSDEDLIVEQVVKLHKIFNDEIR